jgi:hypothetical protein
MFSAIRQLKDSIIRLTMGGMMKPPAEVATVRIPTARPRRRRDSIDALADEGRPEGRADWREDQTVDDVGTGRVEGCGSWKDEETDDVDAACHGEHRAKEASFHDGRAAIGPGQSDSALGSGRLGVPFCAARRKVFRGSRGDETAGQQYEAMWNTATPS